ncbi:hypothetical protein [Nocardioides sp. 503]|uniref:hypothetical protein n=1 Tax=Nocardioides sp. 503 TaxID=2508326 RepID=UPI001070654B|nr:hypothetical protein [Nocardioides sp. 503]
MRTKMVAALAVVVTLGLAGGGFTPAVSAEAPARKAKPYVVTLKALPAQADAGQRLTLAGKVSGPENARKPVLVQRRYAGGAWVVAARATTTKRGTFSVKVPVVKGGTTSFRVLKPRSAKRAQGVSPARSLTVYQWLDVVDQPAIVQGAVAVLDNDVTMNGKRYPGSVLAPGFSSDPVLLAVVTMGLCTTMEAYSGFLDADKPLLGGGETQKLMLSRTTVHQPPVPGPLLTTPVGQVQRATLNVTGAQVAIMSFAVESTEATKGQLLSVLGSPRVRCRTDVLPSVPVAYLQGAARPVTLR